MKCAVHQDVDATGYCRNCGKPMCSVCARPVRDVLYCEDCLANMMGHPAPAAAGSPLPRQTPEPPAASSPYSAPYTAAPAAPVYGSPGALPPAGRRNSPALAFILAFVFPGLGAIYNGQYNKGLIYIAILASLILGITTGLGEGIEPVLGIMMAGLYFYSAFEAMQTAQAMNRGETPSDPLESWSKDRPVIPIILIVLGSLLLLGRFGIWEHLRLGQFWPLILIGAGLYMFRNRLGGRA